MVMATSTTLTKLSKYTQ